MTIFESICEYLRTVEKDKEMTNWIVYSHISKVCNIDTVGKCLRLLERGEYLKAGKDQHGFKWYVVTNKPIPVGLTESELRDRLEFRIKRKYVPSQDLKTEVSELASSVRAVNTILAVVEELQPQEVTLDRLKKCRLALQKGFTALENVVRKVESVHETYTYELENLVEYR